MAVES